MIHKPEKMGIVICKHKANHTDCENDLFVMYMFIDGAMYEGQNQGVPWAFVSSVMIDRVVGVSYGICTECKGRVKK